MAKKSSRSKAAPVLQMVQEDPWLKPFEQDLLDRQARFRQSLQEIEQAAGSLEQFASAYDYLGISYDAARKGWYYREWAPKALALHLMGDFNGWDRQSHPLYRNMHDIWEIFLPEAEYKERFTHGSRVKVQVSSALGAQDRIPAWIRRVVQEKHSNDFSGQLWFPEKAFEWTDEGFDASKIGPLLIYECHVGMAQEREGLGTYREFADHILPRIERLGYNSIQLMAVMEHPYYGSFGYHVSNFFAACSRFGTPEDLKYLINEAHRRGIAVIMDIVHSHAVKNYAEGLNAFDGSYDQYFHSDERGYHEVWDSKLFNYGKWEVKQFLLSNIAFWLREYHFDGFRFDGVTSMLYFHHGHGVDFSSGEQYFREGAEWDAITYLQLATETARRVKPSAILIAEDMSGMPGMCRRIEEGGIGFDYRLAMGIPDFWVKVMKGYRDEHWHPHEIWNHLSNRQWKTKTVAYAESHDQALVGDKTLAFWLMDKFMYSNMLKSDPHPYVDRGISLHKIIRLLSSTLGGEAYLNFMGNEFGHPEWIDFPREGNNWSYRYARRQWSLVDNPDLKYQWLNEFDQAMIGMLRSSALLGTDFAKQLWVDAPRQILIYERGNLVFAFNLHPTQSYPDYAFPAAQGGIHKVILCSDEGRFGGHDRVDVSLDYPCDLDGRLCLYLPNRTGIVLKREETL